MFFAVAIGGCTKRDASIDNNTLVFQNPDYFPAPQYRFSTNTITKNGFELGRKLFYDPALSATGAVSCASCHQQQAAFADAGMALSKGVNGKLGSRNSPAIMNVAWYNSFMWDGGIVDLDLQPIAPVTNHVEMDNTMQTIVQYLQKSNTYPALFQKAFGNNDIKGNDVLKALSQFMLRCISNQSKYDSVMRHEASFTNTEKQGYALFLQKCATCHPAPLFTDQSFRNNGLVTNSEEDKGRFSVTLQASDAYKFKVPSLRNLSFTAPYMHDGRFATLDEVLQHYTTAIKPSATIDAVLLNGTKPSITVSLSEKQQLISFLKTLDDVVFVNNKTLAAP